MQAIIFGICCLKMSLKDFMRSEICVNNAIGLLHQY